MSARACRGQASVLLVGGLAAVLVGVLILGAVARGVAREAGAQRAADLAALAGARAMFDTYPRLFEPVPNAAPPEPPRRGTLRSRATPPSAWGGPTARTRSRSASRTRTRSRRCGSASASARSSRSSATRSVGACRSASTPRRSSRPRVSTPQPRAAATTARSAYRQGKPMRPDVAQAFDRMEARARADGVALLITSAFRSDAEQAALFRAHPDPKWVAPPGTSLHRYAHRARPRPAAPPTDGSPPTRRASTSCSATSGSRGISATR